MHYEEILRLPVTKNDILHALAKAKKQHFIDNLRHRHPNVYFDSVLRGYIGEIALKNWFDNNGIIIEEQNHMNKEGGMDIDFSFNGMELELKTSLIPDKDRTLRNVFLNRDIKLIKRQPTIEQLKSDVHIQIVFQQQTKKKDNWLKKQNINIQSGDLEYLYDAFLAKGFLNRTFLFGWIDKTTLIHRIHQLPKDKQTWSFAKRTFWVCPLRNAFPPKDIINFLKKSHPKTGATP